MLKEGITKEKDAEIVALENELQELTKELQTEYDTVVITDGHTAVEKDGVLFISEAWLENYKSSEIYKFLAQNRILTSIFAKPQLKSAY